jgi:hypothetical protein
LISGARAVARRPNSFNQAMPFASQMKMWSAANAGQHASVVVFDLFSC